MHNQNYDSYKVRFNLDRLVMTVIEDYNWLSTHLDDPDIIILDARGNMSYRFGHIENALPIGIESLISVSENGANLVADSKTAEDVFTKRHIDQSKSVIVYGENSDPSVARVIWTLLYHGHCKVKLLEIGFRDWISAGLAVSKVLPTAPSPANKPFSSQLDKSIRADAQMIKDKMSAGQCIVVDARTPQEHFQARIPESVLHNWEEGIGHDGKMFKERDELILDFEKKGISKDKEIICYCHSGTRASHTYLQLKEAGYNDVRLYDGSIIDWAQRRNPLR
ncbi:MAG TPA: rhodanese-like domain-containing protein [Nitrososphaeraceae archaeon]